MSGIGTKVCALSDGIDLAEVSQSTGELPPVEVLPGQEGVGSEGTALLEIVHDLAPKADLGFATATDSFESYAQNIRDLRFELGCDVIFDDILYIAEAPFQDDAIARAVNSVTDDGALYLSPAGNEGNAIDRTSGNWEGDFRDSGRALLKLAGRAHDFDPGPGVQLVNPLSASSRGVPVTLWWADPLGHADDDYDLYALDAQDNVVAFSDDVQDGDDDPFEALITPEPNLRLAIVRFRGADRYLQVSALNGRFTDKPGLTGFQTPGIIRGHSAAEDAMAIAAAPAFMPLPFDLEPGDPPNPAGPFPDPFTARQQPERYTSDGPRRVFFTPAGRPLTPGDLTSTGGIVRQTPEYTAADGVSTSVPDFEAFYGTSASVAHAAAIASLVLSGNRNDDLADVRAAFDAGSLDLAPAGFDPRSGRGVLRADHILDFTGATPQARARASGVRTLTSSDGDAFLEPGETAAVALTVRNEGDATATDVTVTLETDEPGVTITPQSRPYPDIAAEAASTQNVEVTLPADHPLGKPLVLRVRVRFAGDLSPTLATLSIAVGRPAATTTTFAYTGPPVPIPDDDPAGAEAEIDVTGIGFASQATFSIDGEACTDAEGAETVGLDHTFVSDLVGTLIAPDGTAVQLFVNPDGAGNNLCQAVFDDAAERSLQDALSQEAPFTGSWRPVDPMSRLLGIPADGTWTFRVQDLRGADEGSIRAFALHLAGFEAP